MLVHLSGRRFRLSLLAWANWVVFLPVIVASVLFAFFPGARVTMAKSYSRNRGLCCLSLIVGVGVN